MIISERIFELIKEKGMSQKDFALATGIAQSTISDWKTKKTNPAADKIMVICDVLDVTPIELLSSGNQFKEYEPEESTVSLVLSPEQYEIIEKVQELNEEQVERVLAYIKEMK